MFEFITRLNLDRIFMCVGFGLAGVAAYVVWTEQAPMVSASQLTKAGGNHMHTVQVFDMGKAETGNELHLECTLNPDGQVKYGKVRYVNTTKEIRDAILMDNDYKKVADLCGRMTGAPVKK